MYLLLLVDKGGIGRDYSYGTSRSRSVDEEVETDDTIKGLENRECYSKRIQEAEELPSGGIEIC